MIVFGVESFQDIAAELAPLWRAHYDEAAEDKAAVPFRMDVDRYTALADAGLLVCLTARSHCALVGYVIALMGTHLHCRDVKQAVCDLHYLMPACRGGRTALRMMEAFEAAVRDRGATRILIGTPRAADQGRLLASWGGRPIETTYAKVIA